MRKLILSIVLALISSNIYSSYEGLSVRSYLKTEFDSMFEIKVFEYPKVILDCQSFFNQLVVYENTSSKINEKQIYHLSFEECYQAHEFLYDSQMEKTPVCLKLDKTYKTIELTNKSTLDCN
jgi:hypothetical protein